MQIRCGIATVYIHGKVDKEKIEEATVIFMNKIQRRKNNGYNNKTRDIKEK